MPELRADQLRRCRENRQPLTQRGWKTKYPDGATRIAALIRELDQVAARQQGQPGGVDLADDPIVAALISEGEPAVKPLLDCMENDKRLTRSVHFGRDFSGYRSIIGVREAAYVAISAILQKSFFEPGSTADDLSSQPIAERTAMVRQIRAYWSRFKKVPLVERWFAVLADDNATPEEWLDAAQQITRPGVSPYTASRHVRRRRLGMGERRAVLLAEPHRAVPAVSHCRPPTPRTNALPTGLS